MIDKIEPKQETKGSLQVRVCFCLTPQSNQGLMKGAEALKGSLTLGQCVCVCVYTVYNFLCVYCLCKLVRVC